MIALDLNMFQYAARSLRLSLVPSSICKFLLSCSSHILEPIELRFFSFVIVIGSSLSQKRTPHKHKVYVNPLTSLAA
jgi:hypothetical protein